MKNFITIAVVALTAACTPSVQKLSIAEAAGPAAVEALAAADTEATNADVTAPEINTKPK